MSDRCWFCRRTYADRDFHPVCTGCEFIVNAYGPPTMMSIQIQQAWERWG